MNSLPMFQTRSPTKNRIEFTPATPDSDSDCSVVSDRGCRPLTACKIAPAIATFAYSYISNGSKDVMDGTAGHDTTGVTATFAKTTFSASSTVRCQDSKDLCRLSNLQFFCPKPNRVSSGSSAGMLVKKRTVGTPPPKGSYLDWSDSEEDGSDTEHEYEDEDADEDICSFERLYVLKRRQHDLISQDRDVLDDQILFQSDV